MNLYFSNYPRFISQSGKILLNGSVNAVAIRNLPIGTAKLVITELKSLVFCGDITVRFYNSWEDFGRVNIQPINTKKVKDLLDDDKPFNVPLRGNNWRFFCFEGYAIEHENVEISYVCSN